MLTSKPSSTVGGGGEFLGVRACDVGLEPGARDVEALATGRAGKVNLLGGERPDELAEKTSGYGDDSFFLNLGANPSGYGKFKVGGRELESASIGGDKDITGNGEGST